MDPRLIVLRKFRGSIRHKELFHMEFIKKTLNDESVSVAIEPPRSEVLGSLVCRYDGRIESDATQNVEMEIPFRKFIFITRTVLCL